MFEESGIKMRDVDEIMIGFLIVFRLNVIGWMGDLWFVVLLFVMFDEEEVFI